MSAGSPGAIRGELRLTEEACRRGGRGRDRLLERRAEGVQVPHRLDHRQHAAGQHTVGASHGAFGHLDVEPAETERAVGDPGSRDRVGDEREPIAGHAPGQLDRLRARGGCRRG